MVRFIESEDEWTELMETSLTQLVVVGFTASWCGPCRIIASKLDALAVQYSNVVIVQVDVDSQRNIPDQCGIESIPTFQFFKNGVKADEMLGPDVDLLKKKIEALM